MTLKFGDIFVNSKYINNNAKFIYVAINVEVSELKEIFNFFFSLKILNVVVVGKFHDKFETFSYNPFSERNFYSLNGSDTIKLVFPDKLIDLKGYEYTVFFSINPTRLKVIKGKIYGPDLMFMKTVAMKQNAQFKQHIVSTKDELEKAVHDVIIKNTADIWLNTDMTVVADRPWHLKFVNTYETDGFCAMVPLPEMKSLFDFIYKPFDLWTWILIIISMLGGATVWHFFNKRLQAKSNSPGFFIFAFISNFLGQSVKFREHRPMQKLILQLSIVLTFVLGTIHQSLIISLMSRTHIGAKISTTNELINSKYLFHVSDIFEFDMHVSDAYLKMKPKIIKVYQDYDVFNLNFKQLAADKIAVVETCSLLDEILSKRSSAKDKYSSKYYYKLDEKFSSFYLKFPIPMKTFFHEKLEELSLRVFESGIKYQWNTDIASKTTKNAKSSNSKNLTNLNKILPAFYLLLIGLISSAFTFVLEIFWNDFLRHLKFRNISNSLINRTCKKRKMQQRLVQVQPA